MAALSTGATMGWLALTLFACGLMSAAAAGGGDDDNLMMGRFLRWQAAYNRSYATAEERERRFQVYRRNIVYIKATNRAGNLTYTLGKNQFADLTEQEFLDLYTMKGMPSRGVGHDAGKKSGTIRHDPGKKSGVIRHDLGKKSGVIRHDPGKKSGFIRHDPGKKSGVIRHDPGKKSGVIRHDLGKKSGVIPHDPGKKSGVIRQDPGKKSGVIRHDPGKKSGIIRHDPGKKSGVIRHDPGKKSGIIRHDPGKKSGNIRHDPGKKSGNIRHDPGKKSNVSFAAVDAPPSVDWRAKGAVTPIKNQGPSCSSCWAFVTAATIESITKIKTGNLVSLSEQELIDCDPYDGGCNLGYFVNGYRWVIENGGLTTEASYPYQARRNYCSRSKAAQHAARISDYVQVPAGEAQLQQAVAQQPVAAAIEMGGSLQFYSGGVFSGQCGTRMNHAITVVGYGADASTGLKYWLVKNSWGQSWGERGYLRMRRDATRTGMCGIALDLAYPVV